MLFISANAFSNSLDQIAQQSTVEMDGDIVFYTQEMTEGDFLSLYDQLQSANGITKSTYQAVLTLPCTAEAQKMTPEFLAQLSADGAASSLALTLDCLLYTSRCV